MDQITWDDKDSDLPESDPRRNWRVVDILELKTKFNDNVDEAETNDTAAAGHIASTNNPHSVTKTQVGLGNADNTADANKPVSTAQATAIGVVQSDVNAHGALTNNPHSVTKTQVGLGNVDNTSDATQSAAIFAKFVDAEVPSGAINDVNTTYTTANALVAGSEMLFWNGMKQRVNVGYTISGQNITMAIAPATGDTLEIYYRKP